MTETIPFQLNGRPITLETDATRSLLWVLRTDLALTGTKHGCGAGLCGSCTVVVDGRAVRACRTSLADVRGRAVTTIEGLAADGHLHRIQEAFRAHGAFQCGFCTPGMIMNAYDLLRRTPSPTHAQVVEGMAGNLCRCGAHTRILAAIAAASGQQGGGHE